MQPGQSTTVTLRYIYGQQGLTAVEPVLIPTLNHFGLLALMAALALVGGLLIRRMV